MRVAPEAIRCAVVLLLGVALGSRALAAKDDRAAQSKRAATEFAKAAKSFAVAKEKQARDLAKQLKLEVAPEVWEFFATAKRGDWKAVEAGFEKLRGRAGQYEGSIPDRTVTSVVWQPVLEVELAAEQASQGEPRYALAFGRDIIEAIPAGSVYFGGTDPGRGLVTTLCKSHEHGEPFFTLTQNALADGLYLEYLRQMYGRPLYVPTAEDSQAAFQAYIQDAQKRLIHDTQHPNEPKQIKPGEQVSMTSDGRVQVSGTTAVMAINALLVKVLFDHNTNRQFFLEESYPLDWLYPHLTPHGLIFKINRQPLAALASETLQRDQEYWIKRVQPMLGPWLQPETPTQAVCAFADKVWRRKDLEGFTGDPAFVQNDFANRTYSKLRSSIAGLYTWRAAEAKDARERDRMSRAADFAHRQAFALCPRGSETVWRYATFLAERERRTDAVLVLQTALKLNPPEPESLSSLLEQLQKAPKAGEGKSP